jgi:hypothetical protein
MNGIGNYKAKDMWCSPLDLVPTQFRQDTLNGSKS